ncbi:hypothetical protein D9M73_283200 [compost metagenome]
MHTTAAPLARSMSLYCGNSAVSMKITFGAMNATCQRCSSRESRMLVWAIATSPLNAVQACSSDRLSFSRMHNAVSPRCSLKRVRSRLAIRLVSRCSSSKRYRRLRSTLTSAS